MVMVMVVVVVTYGVIVSSRQTFCKEVKKRWSVAGRQNIIVTTASFLSALLLHSFNSKLRLAIQ